MLQRACLVFSLSLLFNLLAAQATWHWGLHTNTGLSGWPRSEEGEGIRPSGLPYRFTAKERLQLTYGGGVWAAVQAHERWSAQLGLMYRSASSMAVSYYKEGTLFETTWGQRSSWRSQYVQLPVLLRFHWGKNDQQAQPYLGLGMVPTFLWKYQYYSCYCDIEGIPSDLLAGVFQTWTDDAALESEELERSRLRLAGLLELGLEVDKFTLALGTTMFFQTSQKGIPGYYRSLPYIENEDGSFTSQGTPVRYVSSLDVKLYYALR